MALSKGPRSGDGVLGPVTVSGSLTSNRSISSRSPVHLFCSGKFTVTSPFPSIPTKRSRKNLVIEQFQCNFRAVSEQIQNNLKENPEQFQSILKAPAPSAVSRCWRLIRHPHSWALFSILISEQFQCIFI